DERIPGELFAGGEHSRPSRRVDGLHALSEPEVDAGVLPEPGRAKEELVLRLQARQVALRECGPFVRSGRLVAGEDHPSLETFRAQGLGRAGAGETGAGDEHGSRQHHAAFSATTVIAAIGQDSAASRTAGSSVRPTRITASPSGPTAITSGASSAQMPNPLQSERSISILYMSFSFRQVEEAAGRLRGAGGVRGSRIRTKPSQITGPAASSATNGPLRPRRSVPAASAWPSASAKAAKVA